jgi:glycosyltransferase involved in cell wall biosynthesis
MPDFSMRSMLLCLWPRRRTLTVSVVICTRDRLDELRVCLSSLPRQQHPIREVIVVDNASRDSRTRHVALEGGVTYLREDRPGLDIARSTGALHATSDIVAYTDDDVLLHPNWLQNLILAFDDARVGAVSLLSLAQVEPSGTLPFAMMIARYKHADLSGDVSLRG